ncbi:MAG: ATP-binding cassette domain-containing protein [Spirochaetes bacterium]|nr:ATP-binding cassette domain-containing protein [Spirochaetota bacterium]
MSILLDISDVEISFGGLHALNNVSMTIEEGKIISLIGPNGAGKTTLFNIISGTIKPDRGKIMFMQHEITYMRSYKVSRLGISRTYQLRNLYPDLSVFKNIEAGLFKKGSSRADRREGVREVLEFLNITHIQNEVVSGLPPLDTKLVELGRALATGPRLLLLDELIGGLLPSETKKICDAIETLRDRGFTIFQIGHEIRPIMRTSDLIYVLNQGICIASGTPEEIKCNREVITCYLDGLKENDIA